MEKLYFIVGSQDLYGEECLKEVAADAAKMTDFLNEKLADTIRVELLPTVITSETCVKDMRKVMDDDECV
ncbi:MAG: L-arabinose isomerase, partial [Bilifractor sp.]